MIDPSTALRAASGGSRPGRRISSASKRPWVVALVGMMAVGCAQSDVEDTSTNTVVEATRQYLEIVVEAAGELEPIRRVDVMSKASGEVVGVLVDSGEHVEAGTLLARIDPRDVQNDYNQMEADYVVALERFEIAESQLRRSEELFAAGVITEQEHESRNLDFANAQATMVRSETSLELARLRLEDVEIGAPMSGTVLSKSVEEGQVISSPSGNVSGGTVLMTIADLSVMQVRTLVSEADVGRIAAGMEATVFVDAFQDRSFDGTVVKIEPQAAIESNVVNFPVIVSLSNDEGNLRPGMSANVTVLLAERPDAITLPNNAIVAQNEMAVAGEYLGIPNDRLQMDPSEFQALRRGLTSGGDDGGPVPASSDMASAPTTGDGDAGGPPPDLQALREQMSNGDLSPEQLQELMAARGGGAGRGFAGGGGGRGGNARGGGGGGNRQADQDGGTPGVVFVVGDDGQLSPRAVLVGVTDWTNSEILAGLEEGERVVVIGGSALQDDDNRGFRGGRGGMPFF